MAIPMMRESFKRLYKKGKFTKKIIYKQVPRWINKEEYQYITGEKYEDYKDE